eukprot:Lithocolla_globosa_v1_NODE_1016_length_2953_cov_89.685990.p3 type:complete len:129 gc:universal NODE_1016_length_2953_cov_89.685990:855-469(-)
MNTQDWLADVGRFSMEKVSPFFVGMVVFRLIKVVISPPAVSIPTDKGSTSNTNRSLVLSEYTPHNKAACTAAPEATASWGSIDLLSFLPLKKSDTSFWILGICVEPPTNTISSTSDLFNLYLSNVLML